MRTWTNKQSLFKRAKNIKIKSYPNKYKYPNHIQQYPNNILTNKGPYFIE